MSNQGLRHASFRAISGTAGTYTEDARAAFETDVPTIPSTATFDEAFVQWLQFKLTSTNPSLRGLMAEFAISLGLSRWNDVGTISTPPTEFLLLESGDFLLLETGDKIGLE